MRSVRVAAAAALLAAALPALAYVLPAPAILRRLGEKRAALALETLDVTGTLSAEGDAADRLAAVAGVHAAGGQVKQASAPARLRVRVPGRCRLEVSPADAPESARPFVQLRDGKLSGAGGLDQVAPAVALVRTVCALLATSVAGDASGTYAAILGRRGVAVADASLSRFDGRLAYVIGGRAKDPKPLFYVEKDGFQPLRLVSGEGGGALVDVRLLSWGSPMGGDWFPGAVEVWRGDAALLRFATEKTVANGKLDF